MVWLSFVTIPMLLTYRLHSPCVLVFWQTVTFASPSAAASYAVHLAMATAIQPSALTKESTSGVHIDVASAKSSSDASSGTSSGATSDPSSDDPPTPSSSTPDPQHLHHPHLETLIVSRIARVSS